MDRAVTALHTVGQALTSRYWRLHTTDLERDAAIGRFEYTFEAVWKAARAVLLSREGVAASSPKGVVRASHSAGFLGDTEAEAAGT